jgi:hypothetical protein
LSPRNTERKPTPDGSCIKLRKGSLDETCILLGGIFRRHVQPLNEPLSDQNWVLRYNTSVQDKNWFDLDVIFAVNKRKVRY